MALNGIGWSSVFVFPFCTLNHFIVTLIFPFFSADEDNLWTTPSLSDEASFHLEVGSSKMDIVLCYCKCSTPKITESQKSQGWKGPGSQPGQLEAVSAFSHLPHTVIFSDFKFHVSDIMAPGSLYPIDPWGRISYLPGIISISFHSVPPESFPTRVWLQQYLTYFSPSIMTRFYSLEIAAGRSYVSVIRWHLCALENALKDSNTEQWTTASGDSRNQQLIISWNELENVSCKRQIRNQILWQFLKACEMQNYCTVRSNFVFRNISFCPNNHLQENKIEIRVQEWNFSCRYKTE